MHGRSVMNSNMKAPCVNRQCSHCWSVKRVSCGTSNCKKIQGSVQIPQPSSDIRKLRRLVRAVQSSHQHSGTRQRSVHSVRCVAFIFPSSFDRDQFREISFAHCLPTVSSISFNSLKKKSIWHYGKNPSCADLDWSIFSSEEIKKMSPLFQDVNFPWDTDKAGGSAHGKWWMNFTVLWPLFPPSRFPSFISSLLILSSSHSGKSFNQKNSSVVSFFVHRRPFPHEGGSCCWARSKLIHFLALFMSCCSLTAVSSHMCGAASL